MGRAAGAHQHALLFEGAQVAADGHLGDPEVVGQAGDAQPSVVGQLREDRALAFRAFRHHR